MEETKPEVRREIEPVQKIEEKVVSPVKKMELNRSNPFLLSMVEQVSNSTRSGGKSSTLLHHSGNNEGSPKPHLVRFSSNNNSEEESGKYWDDNKKLNILKENSLTKNNIFFKDLEKAKDFYISRGKGFSYLKNIFPIEVHQSEIEDKEELKFEGYDARAKMKIQNYLLKQHKIKIKMNIIKIEEENIDPQGVKEHPWYYITCRVTNLMKKKMDIFELKAYHKDKNQCLMFSFLEILCYLHHTLFVMIFERDRNWILSDLAKKTNSASAKLEHDTKAKEPEVDRLRIMDQTLSTIKGNVTMSIKTEDMTFKTLHRQLEEGIMNNNPTVNDFYKVLKNEIDTSKVAKYLEKVIEKFKIGFIGISFDSNLKDFKFGENQNFKESDNEFKKGISRLISEEAPLEFLEASLMYFYGSSIKIYEILEDRKSVV